MRYSGGIVIFELAMNREIPSLFSSFGDDLLLKVLQTAHEATAVYISEDLHIRFANDAMLKIWGKDTSVIGKKLNDALPELEGQPFIEILQRVWRTGITYSVFDTPANLNIDGKLSTFYFDFEYRPIQDETGKTICIIHNTREVSLRREHLMRLEKTEEQKQALNEEMAATVEELLSTNEELNHSLSLLADSREYIRTIIEQAPVGICMLEGPDLTISIVNNAILKIWGRTEAEVLGKPHEEARPEIKGHPGNDWLRKVLKTGTRRVNHELPVMMHNGAGLRETIINSIYQPIKSLKGEVTGILVILEEVTTQVTVRREHEKAQQMLALAVDAGELATFYYEPETNLFSGNSLLKTWFGLSPEEHIDLSVAIAVIVEEDREKVSKAISDALAPGSDGSYLIEYRIKPFPDIEARTLQATGHVFYDSSGKPLSLNGTLRDLTEQKKEEQRKDAFIGMVSHELKTPLTSLTAYIQLLQRKALLSDDKQLQGTLEKALKQIRSMGTMINGFLNISRLESGRMNLEMSTFDLKELFLELEEEHLATVHTHSIHFNLPESKAIYADRSKIAQVVQNLIGNAIKYSPMGSNITIGCTKPGHKTIAIWVKDEGMGIAPADQPHIFERYYRAKHNQMGSIAGFGIGLYLCREIIERHGGTIGLESEPGSGSTFTCILPITV